MKMKLSVSASACRTVALTLFALPVGAYAQTQQTMTVAELHQPADLTFAPSANDASALNLTDDGVAYSSSVGEKELNAAEDYVSGGEGGGQPAPRRRYGNVNYSDRMHNSDGSNKIVVLAGGGFVIPTNASTQYLSTSWKVQGGVGYNFNRKFGVVLQFDYDHFGLPGSLITSQQAVYNAQNFTYQGGGTVDFSGLGGNTHDWSFTLNPTYTFYQADRTGAYAVVGGGFYHKVTDFTLPETGEYCDYYYGCFEYSANQTFDQYTSNSGGVNGGIGLTYRPSRFASERFYAEARYVHTFNNFKPGNSVNLYPGNSSTTSYVPVTFGLRF